MDASLLERPDPNRPGGGGLPPANPWVPHHVETVTAHRMAGTRVAMGARPVSRGMLPVADAFDVEYEGRDILYGRGRVAGLGIYLDAAGFERAMIVCGSNVGVNRALMAPIEGSLGDRLVAVFDETTPEKTASTIYDGIDRMHEFDPDVLVGVGGGSSLDVARQMSAFEADGRPLAELRAAARDGRIDPPRPEEPTAVIVIPTTFAGADYSNGGSFAVLTADESPSDIPIVTKGEVWPVAMLYDPDLYETTPSGPLLGSAMNGFHKGIEPLYARSATPISDATALHGLRLLHEGIPRVGRGEPGALDRAVLGMLLVQLHKKASLIHAFAHGFSRRYPIQQGHIHAVLGPQVLRYLFGELDANRALIAHGLGIDTADRSADAIADAIVDEVVRVRDAHDLPRRLRDLDHVDRNDFPAIAEFVTGDHLMPEAPADLDTSASAIEAVLHAAW